MATLNVYLAWLPSDPTDSEQQNNSGLKLVGCHLWMYLRQCIAGTGIDTINIEYPMTYVQPSPMGILIYFVPSPFDSVLVAMGGSDRPECNLGGWTRHGSTEGTASEVYLSGFVKDGVASARDLAAIAFHEALHAKTHWPDAKLHPIGGLAGPRPDGSMMVTPPVAKVMKDHIMKDWPQWTRGWSVSTDPTRPRLQGCKT